MHCKARRGWDRQSRVGPARFAKVVHVKARFSGAVLVRSGAVRYCSVWCVVLLHGSHDPAVRGAIRLGVFRCCRVPAWQSRLGAASSRRVRLNWVWQSRYCVARYVWERPDRAPHGSRGSTVQGAVLRGNAGSGLIRYGSRDEEWLGPSRQGIGTASFGSHGAVRHD